LSRMIWKVRLARVLGWYLWPWRSLTKVRRLERSKNCCLGFNTSATASRTSKVYPAQVTSVNNQTRKYTW